MRFGRPLLLLIAVSAAGCFPLPHSDQTFPEVRGTVTRAGLPVAGAKIFAAGPTPGADCDGTEFADTSGQDGAFIIQPKSRFEFFMVIGDPLEKWTVCIEYEGVQYLGWTVTGLGTAPKTARMDCDLDDPVEVRGEGEGLCKVEARR